MFVAADRAYKAGDQVFISYGPKSSTDLFLTYGFAPGETNPHETAPVVLGVLPKGGTPDSGGPSGRLASAMADDRRLDAMDAFTPELPDGQRALVARVGLNGAIPTGLVELAAEISGGGRKEGLALLADACSSARKVRTARVAWQARSREGSGEDAALNEHWQLTMG